MKKGNDLSHWNKDEIFKKCYELSEFVILKATEGTTMKDSTFEERIDKCIQKGKNVGAYHFYSANYNIEWQAENFISCVMDSFLKVKDFHNYGKIPYMLALDVENCNINMNRINEFLDYVETVLNQRPIIYMCLSDYILNQLYKDKKNKYWISAYSRKTDDIFKYDNVIMHQNSNKTTFDNKILSLDNDIYRYDEFLF